MRKYISIVAAALMVVMLIVAGCSDRGTLDPVEPPPDLIGEWGPTPASTFFQNDSLSLAQSNASPQLLFQIRNPQSILEMELIIPREAFPAPNGGGERVPLLVLLAPMDADEFYYRDHGLFELLAEMKASGEIKPMIVLTIANDPTFGGYFYGNSFPAGFYDDIIADSTSRGLLGNIVGLKLHDLLISTPNKQGIGGIGQGAYGAFRHILKNPGVYESITVADGPLSFASLQPLFVEAIAEQQIRWAAKQAAGKIALDSTFTIQAFDTLVSMPVSRMFVGGSLAFSPNDTAVFYSLHDPSTPTQERPDIVTIDSSFGWADPGDVSTFVTMVWDLIPQSEGNWWFHLPFFTDGSINQSIWDRWMENDLEQLLTDAPLGALDSVSIWIGTSTESAGMNYHEATEDWTNTLISGGHGKDSVSVFNYTGYAGHPATSGDYTYDLLKQMLKFHSDAFYPEPETSPSE